ncbi:MAG TPA: hypothetical protein VF648_05340 [Pyrinomonadaceae bacterium]|jgi:hypothetical protein
MAINTSLIRRPSDRGLFLAAAIGFPLIVFIGYFKSYYFSSLFADARPIANSLVHLHGIVMSVWVAYFVAQVALIRTKNIKLHMTMGMGGIALAALVVIVGLATAYDAQLVRSSAPPGIDSHEFFILPVGDMLLFAIYFAGAIYYRKRPREHKSLMLMTAINFMPAALFRVSFVPESYTLLFTFGVPGLIAILCFAWLRMKHGKFNRVFAAALLLYFIALPFPFRMVLAQTTVWHSIVNWMAP